MKPQSNSHRGVPENLQAEYESVGADVVVEVVRDDMKARIATLRERLRNSLGKPDRQR